VLRLSAAGLSKRQIAASLPLPDDLDDDAPERRL